MESSSKLKKISDVFNGTKDASETFTKAINQLSKINKKEVTSDATLTFAVAPEFKNCTKEAFNKMDEFLKLTILPTMNALQKMNMKTASWDDIVSVMAQNESIEPKGDAVLKNDHMENNGSNFFGAGDPDKAVIEKVYSWFRALIGDEQVLNTTQIDIHSLAIIVASTGIIAESLVQYLYAAEYKEKTLIDVGVIRYPDFDNPYYKLYRIHLKAFAKSKKIAGIYNEVKSGITGEYAVRLYKPREDVLKGIKEETREKAVEELQKTFDSLFA